MKINQDKFAPERRGKLGVRTWLAVFFTLGVLATLLAQSLLSWLHGDQAAPGVAQLVPAGGQSDGLNQGSNGTAKPWGNLEFTRFLLEPDDVFQEKPKQPIPTRWVFEHFSPAQLADVFNTGDLTDRQKAFFQDTNHWEILTNGCAITPPDDLILGLSQAACQRIYPVLAQSSISNPQSYPFQFQPDGFDERFGNCGLSPENVNLIRSQTYTNDGWLCFSTLQPLQNSFSLPEYQCLVRALYTIRAVRARLLIGPDSDIAGLVKYWGRGGREKEIRPILESLARIPGGQSIDVSAFFPPFPRLHLNTYPDPYADPDVAKKDCFYTMLNFFDPEPNQQFLDHRNARTALLTDYYKPKDGPLFGDLLVFVDANGNALHVCCYVADDLVFTKDGVGYLQPWAIMKLSDMVADYPGARSMQIVHLRRVGM